MSIKGKIYAKYLKRAKYVVKGRKLKTPIAVIKRRTVPVSAQYAPQNIKQANVQQMKPQNGVGRNMNAQRDNGLQLKKVNSSEFDSKNGKRGLKELDKISFVELGKKIVDGEDETSNKKSDSKTLMIVCTALAIIVIVALVKVGSMVYTEIGSNKNVAKKDSKQIEENDELTDFLLNGDGTVENPPTEEEMNEILNDVLQSEGTDINSVTQEEKQEKLKAIEQIIQQTNTGSASTPVSRQEYLDNIKDKLTGVGQESNGSTNSDGNSNNNNEPAKPTETPTKPKPTEPGIAAGDDDKVTYATLGNSDKAFVLYRVAKDSVVASSAGANVYSNVNVEGGSVKVPEKDSYGLWFIDEGDGIRPFTAYSSSRKSIFTVITKVKEDGEYVPKGKYYVMSGATLKLDGEYTESQDGEDGKEAFTVCSDMTLYKK